MNKPEVVDQLLRDRPRFPETGDARAAASANIALCKYWGKRDEALNLPVTSSLSVSLGARGSETRLSVLPGGQADRVQLNGAVVSPGDTFARRITSFLDLFGTRPALAVDTCNTVPTAAGVASSASGFAALVLALDRLCAWDLAPRDLSILARLGSGSACRSIHAGFVEWHAGSREDGMDSFAEPLPAAWPELCIGLLTVSGERKPMGSRQAMRHTRKTSALYPQWPLQVADDLVALRAAVRDRDFEALGTAAEGNALAMHATMLAARPPVLYWLPDSVALIHRVFRERAEGLSVYLTMDAGPNLKLLFLRADEDGVRARFPGIEVMRPFDEAQRDAPCHAP